MENTGPLYYHDGQAVFKRGVEHQQPDGKFSYTVGFRICLVSEHVVGAAEEIANALNAADRRSQDLESILESIDERADQAIRDGFGPDIALVMIPQYDNLRAAIAYELGKIVRELTDTKP